MPPPPQPWKARDYRLRTIKSIQTHPNAFNISIKVIYVLIPSMPVMACHSLLSLCLCRSFSSSTTTPDARKGRGCCGGCLVSRPHVSHIVYSVNTPHRSRSTRVDYSHICTTTRRRTLSNTWRRLCSSACRKDGWMFGWMVVMGTAKEENLNQSAIA